MRLMKIDYGELKLTDLIDREILQKVQDGFANMTGMAALTTETDGTAVTEGSNFSDFCMRYTRGSKIGCERCKQCDSQGAGLALERGESVVYFCHAGLMDFAAPIMAEDKMVGCFIGGQVLTESPDPEQVLTIAKEIGGCSDLVAHIGKKIRLHVRRPLKFLIGAIDKVFIIGHL